MDDNQYLEELMTQVSARKIRSLDDVADDVRSNLNKTVESIIDAGKALQEGRDMHPSDQAFGNWCANEFPELHRKTRLRFMQIANRFSETEKSHQLGYSVLAELAAPSVSDDVVEQVINAPIPMKLAEVKALKSNPKEVDTRPTLQEHADAMGVSLETVTKWEKVRVAIMSYPELAAKSNTFEGYMEAKADLISYQNEEQDAKKELRARNAEIIRKQMEATPQQFDLLEHVKSTKSYDLNETARCLSINMEHLHWKSGRSEIKEAIRAAIIDDVVGIKVPALHGLAEILRELADEMPVINATKLN